ncbi:TraM recognition domain-containing protein [Cryobacterium sp. 10I1]|uniref:TraM recognition domain-containing protein n=1 Tax=unclassified Cryobacterium TaxID=2649013 RepID=UPI002B225984|nr:MULTISPECIES: TraM recognition domain-containing protein [unclassified Cryobacterium]MEB0202491.1 TraM recognition domain-containing protein [Cryobacterium sp. 5I3]MEB0304041.1 TraM recognition domain-containing protein [Cryobacterium sp. 10I1]
MIDTKGKWLTGVLAALILGGLYLAVHVGAALTPTGHTYSWNFFTLLGDMVLRGAPWPPAATGASVVALILALVVFVGLMAWLARRAANKRGNAAIAHMATRKQSAVLRQKARTKEAAQLHPHAESLPAGQSVGQLIGTKKWVLQGWRELGVYVFGPGRGKTSGIVIRHMIEAPGPAIMTSNKVDGVRETLAGRHDRGRAFIFDPNRIYRRDFTPDFIFNPLDYIENAADAKELAAIFEASTRKASDRGGDAQFDTSGRDLLAYFFLAAKLENQPLSMVYTWIARGLGKDVQAILEEHGKQGPADAIAGVMLSPEKTRGSVFATAQRMASALADDELLLWTSTEGIRRFQPAEFITSSDTLVLLSKDGEGSGGALLTALVRTICKTAQRAAESNGGRLTVPLVMELDECANIVKWPELPSVYSYYGSLGIILNTYFQSRAQGIEAFGREGWGTLWDAASNRVFGGGVLDDEFLKTIAALIGEHDEITYGSSTGRDGAMSTSTNTRKVSTMDVAALAALPQWRAIVFNSKSRPVMVQTVPWFTDTALKARVAAGSAPDSAATTPEKVVIHE